MHAPLRQLSVSIIDSWADTTFPTPTFISTWYYTETRCQRKHLLQLSVFYDRINNTRNNELVLTVWVGGNFFNNLVWDELRSGLECKKWGAHQIKDFFKSSKFTELFRFLTLLRASHEADWAFKLYFRAFETFTFLNFMKVFQTSTTACYSFFVKLLTSLLQDFFRWSIIFDLQIFLYI